MFEQLIFSCNVNCFIKTKDNILINFCIPLDCLSYKYCVFFFKFSVDLINTKFLVFNFDIVVAFINVSQVLVICSLGSSHLNIKYKFIYDFLIYIFCGFSVLAYNLSFKLHHNSYVLGTKGILSVYFVGPSLTATL